MSEQDRPNPKIVDLVRKLLVRTTQSGCTIAEATAAYTKATEILTLHNLSMEDVQASATGEPKEKFTEEAAIVTARWTIEMNMAYAIVKEFYFVEGIFLDRDGRERTLYLFGTESNVAAARHIFVSLLTTSDRLWTIYHIVKRRPIKDRRIYIIGLMSGFRDKLRENREALKAEQDILHHTSGGTALAIRKIEDHTQEEYRKAHPTAKNAKTGFSKIVGDQSTMNDGYKTGHKLNFNRAIGSTKKKAIE